MDIHKPARIWSNLARRLNPEPPDVGEVNLDVLAKQADQSHPLTYEGAGIPVTYCIVPRLSVLDAIEELRASRKAANEALAYLADPSGWLALRGKALADAAFYAALKVIRIQAEQLLDVEHKAG